MYAYASRVGGVSVARLKREINNDSVNGAVGETPAEWAGQCGELTVRRKKMTA